MMLGKFLSPDDGRPSGAALALVATALTGVSLGVLLANVHKRKLRFQVGTCLVYFSLAVYNTVG
jgi:hypothetical protein